MHKIVNKNSEIYIILQRKFKLFKMRPADYKCNTSFCFNILDHLSRRLLGNDQAVTLRNGVETFGNLVALWAFGFFNFVSYELCLYED